MPHQAADHSIDRKLLEAALPRDHGGFAMEDQFQCYAFMWLQFECCACGRTEMFEDADYPGLGWIISAAGRARHDGWTLAPWSSDGVLDGRLRCPECSQRVL
jgi:hypothetical protein